MGLLDSLASSLDVDDDVDGDSPFGFDIVEEAPTDDRADADADADAEAPAVVDVTEADAPATADDDGTGATADAAVPDRDRRDRRDADDGLGNPRSDGDWVEAEAPTGETLFGVVQTVRGPVAVGTDGLVLGRRASGWERLVDRGPAARANSLADVDVTDDGERVWFAGGGGALGMYDVVDSRKYDFSAPLDEGVAWESIAVAGTGEDGRLLAATADGAVVGAAFDDEGRPHFGEPATPGEGSTFTAVDVADGVGYAVDTAAGAYRLRDDEWERVGVDGAAVGFRDVFAAPDGRLLVAGDEGLCYRFDPTFERWTPLAIGSAGFHAVDVADGRTVAVGAEGSIHGRRADADWRAVPSPVTDELLDVALGPLDVAVGVDGVVVERSATTGGRR